MLERAEPLEVIGLIMSRIRSTRPFYQYEHCFSYEWEAMRGYHYLMRLGHALNVLARYSTGLAKYVRDLGVRGLIDGKWHTLRNSPNFDRDGLWHFKGIGFSKQGTLTATIGYLVGRIADFWATVGANQGRASARTAGGQPAAIQARPPCSRRSRSKSKCSTACASRCALPRLAERRASTPVAAR